MIGRTCLTVAVELTSFLAESAFVAGCPLSVCLLAPPTHGPLTVSHRPTSVPACPCGHSSAAFFSPDISLREIFFRPPFFREFARGKVPLLPPCFSTRVRYDGRFSSLSRDSCPTGSPPGNGTSRSSAPTSALRRLPGQLIFPSGPI